MCKNSKGTGKGYGCHVYRYRASQYSVARLAIAFLYSPYTSVSIPPLVTLKNS